MSSSTPTKLRVIIVRHGETRENVQRIIQGQLDTPLNDCGRLQADITGQYLANNMHIDRIIASPLKRAADTARLIHQHQRSKARNVQLEFDDRLKERSFGVLEGLVYSGAHTKPEETEGIEKMQPFSERLASFWNDLVTRTVSTQQASGEQAEDRTETVVLVSHGGAISALMNQVLVPGRYCLVSPTVAPSRFWNCSLTELLVPVIHTRSSVKPGDLARKSSWSIRPIHLGVQGCQLLLDHELQKQLLASARSANTPQHSKAADAVKDLQAVVDKTASEFERDPEGKKLLEADTIKAPDGTTVHNDIGYGKGVGIVLRWSDVEHLKEMEKQADGTSGPVSSSSSASSSNVNVDELVK